MSLGLSSTSRISTASGFIRRLFAEREVEGRAVTGTGFGPDPAAVAEHDALGDCEPDPGALVFLGAVETLEDAEQTIRILHVEADAVVAHVVDAIRRRGTVHQAADL